MTDVIDGTLADESGEDLAPPPTNASTEVALRLPAEPAMVPMVQAEDLVARLARITEVQHQAMVAGVDYGVIPGTSGKPSLLKPGAEKLGVTFKLRVTFATTEAWGPGDHLTVRSRALVWDIPTGLQVAEGEGLCSTREKKYGKRQAALTCPNCSQPAIIKGKAEYGGGWVCFARKGGCGAKFDDRDQAITGQPRGEVENPDLADTWNTILKMANKRARVDGILAATGASAIFTQDVEDDPTAVEAMAAPAELPAWAQEAAPKRKQAGHAALCYLLGEDPKLTAAGGREKIATDVFAALRDELFGGVVPEAAVAPIIRAAGILNRLLNEPQQAAAPPEDAELAARAEAAVAADRGEAQA